MEDVLDVYTRPYDSRYPQVCFDERPVQLTADVREPLPARPDTPEHRGIPVREDYEYERKGCANLFLWYEPLRSRRHVEVTDHGCRDDWAHCIKDLVDVHYPDAEKIVVVLDNLNSRHRCGVVGAGQTCPGFPVMGRHRPYSWYQEPGHDKSCREYTVHVRSSSPSRSPNQSPIHRHFAAGLRVEGNRREVDRAGQHGCLSSCWRSV
jgi:hypothetical protein